jgi:PIN domain nuclease of toxin-antitoxin system
LVDVRHLGTWKEQAADGPAGADAGPTCHQRCSFWEIALLIANRRPRPVDSAAEIRRQMLAEGATELPLNGEIAIIAGELDGLHADPADRFIAATAIAHDATLVTADDRLLKWRHSLRRHNAET